MTQRLLLGSAYHIDSYEDVPRVAMQQEENRKAAYSHYLANLSAHGLTALYQEYLSRLNQQITALEVEKALHAPAARNLYVKFEEAINSYFQQKAFSKLPDVLMIEALRHTTQLLETAPLQNGQPNPDYRQRLSAFNSSMDDMKRHRLTSAIAGAGIIVGMVVAVAIAVVMSLYTFGIFGGAALTVSSLITFGSMAAVETGVVGWSIYKATGLFNQSSKAKGIEAEMAALRAKI